MGIICLMNFVSMIRYGNAGVPGIRMDEEDVVLNVIAVPRVWLIDLKTRLFGINVTAGPNSAIVSVQYQLLLAP